MIHVQIFLFLKPFEYLQYRIEIHALQSSNKSTVHGALLLVLNFSEVHNYIIHVLKVTHIEFIFQSHQCKFSINFLYSSLPCPLVTAFFILLYQGRMPVFFIMSSNASRPQLHLAHHKLTDLLNLACPHLKTSFSFQLLSPNCLHHHKDFVVHHL